MHKLCWFRSICLFLASATTIYGTEFDIDSLQKRVFATIDSVKPAVVSIRQRGGMFSGVIISSEGHVLSAGHAVSPGKTYQILLPDGRQFEARGKGSNPKADCALLKITAEVDNLPYARMGHSESLVRNQPCLSISFPGGQGVRGKPLVRFGRLVTTGGGRGMLQSTALMEPGDSGGPLFDLQGRVIGIHSRIGRSMTRNFEVPIDTFKDYWNELNRAKSFTESGPSVPKLGVRGNDQPDRSGIKVLEVVDDSLAAKSGVKPNDIIKAVHGNATPSVEDLRKVLVAAREATGVKEIVINVQRADEDVALKVAFDFKKDIAPKVSLPKYDEIVFSEPKGIGQLTNLPAQFSDLESELDKACVKIASKLPDGKELAIVGTLIKDTPLIVSKSSLVKEDPKTNLASTDVDLEIIARDSENDLVLLKSPTRNMVGVDIHVEVFKSPKIGSFLITPDSSGSGFISIISTSSFPSRKQQSRGFLGVMPSDYQDKGGAILREVTRGGTAAAAGLQVGDVVIKLNKTVIKTHMDMRRFLGTVDPNETIIATIMRGDEELQKSIVLGAYPSSSNHAADQMRKSDRRDGFSSVIAHDADLKPEDCGGPLFDLYGNFVGLNIARNSRVRSYAVPPYTVRKLVEDNRTAIDD